MAKAVQLAVVGLVVAFVLFYLISSPDNAADIVRGAGDLLSDIAHGVGRFIDKLAS